MVQVEKTPDLCRLALSGELTIYQADAVKAALDSALAEVQQPVELDLTAVTEVDTAGLQLVLSVCRHHSGRLGACSTTVQELVALYGLAAGINQAGEEAA